MGLKDHLAKHSLAIGAIIIAAVATAQILYLLRANRAYADTIDAIREAEISEAKVAVGHRVSTLTGFSLTGSRAEYQVDDGLNGSVLIAIAASCDPCTRSMPALRRLAYEALHRGRTVIWVSRDGIAPMNASPNGRDLPGHLIVDPSYATYFAARLSRVPHISLLSPTGHVTHTWHGFLSDDESREVSEAILQNQILASKPSQ